MKLQYIEIFRNAERVYQGVAIGRGDAAHQLDCITRDAVLNNQEIPRQSEDYYKIIDAETRELWGWVKLCTVETEKDPVGALQ